MYSVKCNLCQLRIDLEFVPISIIREKLFLILFCTSFDRCVLFYTIESTWLKFQIFLVPQSLEISCVLIETNYKNKCEPSANSVLFDAKDARYIKKITFSNVDFEFIPACLLTKQLFHVCESANSSSSSSSSLMTAWFLLFTVNILFKFLIKTLHRIYIHICICIPLLDPYNSINHRKV